MALPIFRYPLDETGVNPDNLVVREPHTLIPKTRPTDVRVTAPIYGPFYADSNLTILDAANGRALVPGIDFKVTDLLQDPTLLFAKPIGQFIVITNGTVSNEIEISYQVLGGNYQNDSTAVQHAFETFLNDTRPVDWSNVTGRPSTFPPSLHLHLLSDIINFGPLVVAIDSLRDAKLLNNTPMFEALIDWINTKKVAWADITGKPTLAQGWLTDVVFLAGDQQIAGKKDFLSAIIRRSSMVESAHDASLAPAVNTNDLARAADPLVAKTTAVIAGLGLTGGGQLQGDITLSMGVPGDLTKTSIGETTALGHTHKVDVPSLSGNTPDTFANGADSRIVNAVPNARRIIAGNGLVTGGALTGDVTIDMGQPLTVNKTSQNQVTADGHTHALDMAAIASGIFPTVYRDFTGQRLVGQVYRNTTNTFRIVTITVGTNRNGNSTIWAYVDNVQVCAKQTSYDHAANNVVSIMVPAGSTYYFNIGNFATGVHQWTELSTPESTD